MKQKKRTNEISSLQKEENDKDHREINTIEVKGEKRKDQ